MEQELWIGFVGHCADSSADAVRKYEDDVLALLPRHGAEVVMRANRAKGQGETLPAEMQILRFPSRTAFDAFLEDPDRRRLMELHGEVFSDKAAVEIDAPFIRPTPQADR